MSGVAGVDLRPRPTRSSPDYLLIGITAVLSILGLVMILSATGPRLEAAGIARTQQMTRQAIVVGLGIVVFFGGLMGAIALWSVRHPIPLQFLWGTILGTAVELANSFGLNLWEFDPGTFGRIPGPWIRAIAVGAVVGLVIVVINQIVGALYRLRLRLG